MFQKHRSKEWSVLVIVSLVAMQVSDVFAASNRNPFINEKQNISQISEFIYGDEAEQKLVPIYLLGSVSQPGIYHVPPKTDLTTLLAIAGGPSPNSRLTDITIRNEISSKFEKIDYEELSKNIELKSPFLNGKDIVFVPEREPLISQNAVTLLTVVGTALAIVATGLIVRKELK